MHVQEIFVHPIKSLRPIALERTQVLALGPLHDRIFLLQRVIPSTAPDDGPTYHTLHVTYYPQLCLFVQKFGSSGSELLVCYTPPIVEDSRELTVPLNPDVSNLVKREIKMHGSSCSAYDMGDSYAAFFTTCLGFSTRLVYLGPSGRPILGSVIPEDGKVSSDKIRFADCAPLLVTSQASLDEVSSRLPGDEKMDISKFRSNIVIAADADDNYGPWDEDFWGEIEIAGHPVILTANCARCNSLNCDYKTGAVVENGQQPLKKLMGDRRVDKGSKWRPIFGRYGLLGEPGETGITVSVGDKVVVSKRNSERTKFYWPGLSDPTEVQQT